MSIAFAPSFRTDSLCVSHVLRHTFSKLSPIAIAILDDGGDGVALGTLPAMPSDAPRPDIQSKRLTNPGTAVGFEATQLSDRDLERLNAYAGQDRAEGKWSAFVCRYSSGRVDRIAIRVSPDSDDARLLGFWSLIWPVLREDCLHEITRAGTEIADEAMLWLIAKKMDLAVFVMNDQGMMIRRNEAARLLLDQGHILRRTPRGIACASDCQTAALRAAVAACAAADPDHADSVHFILSDHAETAGRLAQVPVTLSRFFHEGEPTPLVTMVLPSPPDRQRVEKMAREMGLTHAEARVAALMQLGLSNREAARMAGLTEQSLCTYAKRVLSKLNVASRAEAAQMLTWQTQGGPVA